MNYGSGMSLVCMPAVSARCSKGQTQQVSRNMRVSGTEPAALEWPAASPGLPGDTARNVVWRGENGTAERMSGAVLTTTAHQATPGRSLSWSSHVSITYKHFAGDVWLAHCTVSPKAQCQWWCSACSVQPHIEPSSTPACMTRLCFLH